MLTGRRGNVSAIFHAKKPAGACREAAISPALFCAKRSEMVKEIELISGGVALVDDDDYPVLSIYLWYQNKNGYAYRIKQINEVTVHSIMMHQVVRISKKGMEIDHIDRNKLNNQKANLRLVTKSQNKQNREKMANTRSRYIGVWPVGDKWVARIGKDGKKIHLGTYNHECVAALAYNRAARKLYGKHAMVNDW